MGVEQWLSISTQWRRKWPTTPSSTTTTSTTVRKTRRSFSPITKATAATSIAPSSSSPSPSSSSIPSTTTMTSATTDHHINHHKCCRLSAPPTRIRSSSTPSSSFHLVHQWIYYALLIAFLLIIPTLASDGWGDEVRWNYEDYSQVTRVPLDPVFLPTKNNITVREGATASLPCKLQHQGTKRVAWRRVDLDMFLTIGEMSWDNDRELEVKHDKPSEELDEWTLILPRVGKKDAGLYECQVTSVTGFHTLVRLNVVGPRLTQPAVHMYGTQFVGRGDQLNLTCNATGGNRTADDVDWFKDGNIIGSGKDYVILKYTMIEQGALVSTLHVDRAKQEHAGTYVCRSSHGQLDSIAVQVLVTDSSNVKRDFPDVPPGTVSSNRQGAGAAGGGAAGATAAAMALTSHGFHQIILHCVIVATGIIAVRYHTITHR